MNVTIRPERANDYEEILHMTYDAFLTLDYPGRRRMDEHFLILLLQDCDRAIPELRFVAEHDGEIVGHIFYARTAFRRPDGTHAETVTFGPLTVEPKYHRQRIGKALVSHTLEIAREKGFGAVIITGVPEYYPKLGFKRAREYGLTMEDGSSPDSLMVYELKPGYLSGGGVFDTWPAEYDRAEQDDEGYNAFNIAYAKKHFPGKVTLRPLFEADVTLMKKWLQAPHVARWYEHPDAWGMELAERHGEFSFITHFIAEYEGIQFGFCQYYDCHLAQEYEEWDSTWHISERKGEVFSIDYLIGEPDYLRRGFGKAMVAQMVERLQAIGTKVVIVEPEKENAASTKALVACGFEQQGSEYVLDLVESGYGNQKH